MINAEGLYRISTFQSFKSYKWKNTQQLYILKDKLWMIQIEIELFSESELYSRQSILVQASHTFFCQEDNGEMSV